MFLDVYNYLMFYLETVDPGSGLAPASVCLRTCYITFVL